jgi:hypothetical protein
MKVLMELAELRELREEIQGIIVPRKPSHVSMRLLRAVRHE